VKLPRRFWWLGLVVLAGCSSAADDSRPIVRTGSKKFTEGEILGEMLAQLATDAGARGSHLDSLGDTSIVWNGLRTGAIDAYVEYTGTLTQDVLSQQHLKTEAELRQALHEHGIRMSKPLGFNNTYAVGMRAQHADELGIRTISDLRQHPNLRMGFSNEFMKREKDGWAPLRRRYRLPQATPDGAEHDIAYQALANGIVDVTDVYATDAKLRTYRFRLLEDDLKFFPAYDAVVLYRADLEQRAPEVVKSLLRLEGRIDATKMIELNASVDIDRVSVPRVAADFLSSNLDLHSDIADESLTQRLFDRTWQHLRLVGVSLALGVVVALPLGILAAKVRSVGQPILFLVGMVQTIPSIALLVLLLVALHMELGWRPAIVALFLYSLLPIVRNTYSGLHDIPVQLHESAEALGLSPLARLRLIELPMASRSILAGIKTAAVINVGNATLGGLIAAGGYGQDIFVGLNRNDPHLILEGAIPAVLLALAVQGLFELADRILVPKGLRLRPVS
jgi:osmoprotectant transport system permease protein